MAITVLKSWRTPRKGGSLAFKDKKETERRKSESGKRTVRTARKPKGQYCFPWSSEEMQRRSTYIADRTVSRRTSTRLSSHASDRRGKDLAKAALMPFAIRRARENTELSDLDLSEDDPIQDDYMDTASEPGSSGSDEELTVDDDMDAASEAGGSDLQENDTVSVTDSESSDSDDDEVHFVVPGTTGPRSAHIPTVTSWQAQAANSDTDDDTDDELDNDGEDRDWSEADDDNEGGKATRPRGAQAKWDEAPYNMRNDVDNEAWAIAEDMLEAPPGMFEHGVQRRWKQTAQSHIAVPYGVTRSAKRVDKARKQHAPDYLQALRMFIDQKNATKSGLAAVQYDAALEAFESRVKTALQAYRRGYKKLPSGSLKTAVSAITNFVMAQRVDSSTAKDLIYASDKPQEWFQGRITKGQACFVTGQAVKSAVELALLVSRDARRKRVEERVCTVLKKYFRSEYQS